MTQQTWADTDLKALAERIHSNAVAHGFWTEDRNFGEMMALVGSELYEALEEHRSGKPLLYVPVHVQGCPASSDGLPDERTDEERLDVCTGEKCKPEGIAVELADCVIRCLDTLYSLDPEFSRFIPELDYSMLTLYENFGESITSLCLHAGLAWDGHREGNVESTIEHLLLIVYGCELLAFGEGALNWWGVVLRKCLFNEGRPFRHNRAY